MNDQTKPVTPATPAQKIVVHDDGPMAAFLDTGLFEQIQRAGRMLAEAKNIPESYQGKPADCAIALALARQLQVNVLQLMNKLYVIHGRPGMEAQFKIALANTRGPFEGPIDWNVKGEGDSRVWTAFAKMRGTNRVVDFEVPWSMVTAEGWDRPKGKGDFKQPSKWMTMPEKMGRYRSASYLIDLYCPEVALGMSTLEELQDMTEIQGERVDTTPIKQPRSRKAVSDQSTTKAEEFEQVINQTDIGNDNRFYRQAEAIDKETGEITNPLGSDGEATSGIVEPINGEASQAIEPPRTEPTEPAQKTVQASEPSNGGVVAQKRSFTESEMKPISPGIKGVLKTKLENAALTTEDFRKGFGKGIDELLIHEVDAAIEFCNNPMGKK